MRYYPNRNSCSITAVIDSNAYITSITTYPITLTPTIESEYLTTISVSDTSVTVASTVPTNPTTIGYTNIAYANSNVILMVDGEDYISALADADGTVSHYYEGTWDTSHTFTWKQGAALIFPTRLNGAPSGILSSGTSSVDLLLDTDQTATCKYGTLVGVAYDEISDTFSNTNATTILN